MREADIHCPPVHPAYRYRIHASLDGNRCQTVGLQARFSGLAELDPPEESKDEEMVPKLSRICDAEGICASWGHAFEK